MAEYRHSAQAVYDIKYHGDLGDKVSLQDPAGEDRRACARPDPTDLPESGHGHSAWVGVARSYPPAAVGAAAIGAGETGAIHQRPVVEKTTRGIPGVTKAVLGAASMGTRVLLRECGGRWTSRRSSNTSRINGGTKTTRGSRSQRLPSLEPALQPGDLQAALAATRLSVGTGFYRL
jgi:hypothetical protein